MDGDIPPLPQEAFVVWCSIKKKHRNYFSFTTLSITGLHIKLYEPTFLSFPIQSLFLLSEPSSTSKLRLDGRFCIIIETKYTRSPSVNLFSYKLISALLLNFQINMLIFLLSCLIFAYIQIYTRSIKAIKTGIVSPLHRMRKVNA
jgi:hypothetical protein